MLAVLLHRVEPSVRGVVVAHRVTPLVRGLAAQGFAINAYFEESPGVAPLCAVAQG